MPVGDRLINLSPSNLPTQVLNACWSTERVGLGAEQVLNACWSTERVGLGAEQIQV